jgi:PAS domain S-box-containing protein
VAVVGATAGSPALPHTPADTLSPMGESPTTGAASLHVSVPRELLEAVLEPIPIPVVLVELDTGSMTFANRAADQLVGGAFPKASSVGDHGELYALTDTDGRRLAPEEAPGARVARGESFAGLQLDWQLPDRKASLLVSGATIRAGDSGPVGVVAFEDITSLRAAEQLKDESLALLDTLFSSAPVGLAFFDRELRYVAVNEALAQINGVPIEAHRGRTVPEVLPGIDPSVVEGLRRVLESGEPLVDVEVSGETPARPGERRHWLAGFYPVRHRETGEVFGLGAVLSDITERVALLDAERRARERAERAERRSAFLAKAGEVLSTSLDYEATLQRVARVAVPAKADWCVVDLLRPDGTIDRLAVANADPAQEHLGRELQRRFPPRIDDPGGVPAVIRTGLPRLYAEVADEGLRASSRHPEHLRILRRLGLSSALIVPLRVRGRTLGALSFYLARAGQHYDGEDLALAVDLARRAALAIDNARLHRERSHIAQTLQRSLLPPMLPEIPGFELAARYLAAGEGNEVGGDLYDVFETREGAWAFVVGDVCGKGPEAASLTSLVRYTLRAAALVERDPARVLATTNEAILRERSEGRFMTAVHGTLEPQTAVLRLANAGHPPALVVRRTGEVEPIEAAGTLLGIVPSATFGRARVALAPGDALVAYTDGVLDAAAPARVLDVAGLARLCAPLAGRAAGELAEAVERGALEAAEGDPRDDIAVLVVRRLEAPAG